jgi:hypothetical protein
MNPVLDQVHFIGHGGSPAVYPKRIEHLQQKVGHDRQDLQQMVRLAVERTQARDIAPKMFHSILR